MKIRDEVMTMAKEKHVAPGEGFKYPGPARICLRRFRDALAILYTGLGEKQQALEQLEKAVEERVGFFIHLKVEPLFDPLHSEPRFADLVQRLGLPQ